MRIRIAWLAGAVLLWSLPSVAQTGEKPGLSPFDSAKLHFPLSLRTGDKIEAAKNRLLLVFLKTDLDGGGVSESDYRLVAQTYFARQRAGRFRSWLSQDLDANGEVTRAELETIFSRDASRPRRRGAAIDRPTPEQIRGKVDKAVGKVMVADENGDGVISFAEAMKAVNKKLAAQMRTFTGRRPIPLSLDRDGDGVVSEVEFLETADRLLRHIDADGNGILDYKEQSQFRREKADLKKAGRERRLARENAEKNREIARQCGFPVVPKTAQVVLLGVSEGKALSIVSLGDDDAVVTVADVLIEAGTTPLYVVLSSRNAMIWRFSGAVRRITHLVASSKQRGASRAARVGIVGLPADRVVIPASEKCVPHFSRASSRAARNTATLLPRPPGIRAGVVFIFGGRLVSTVSLPSGIFDKIPVYVNAVDLPKSGPGASVWRYTSRIWRGGVVKIDAAKVVSPLAAKPYRVLPHMAGVAQLLDKGALQVIGNPAAPKKFLITKKIRFPPGFSRRHSVQFVLAPGVQEPSGSPGKSTVERQ